MLKTTHFSALLLIFGSLLITGCGYSVEQLVRDTPLRTKVLKDCVSMGLKAKDEDKCLKAAEAQARVTGESIKSLFK
ncbi:MAG: EexN family lipoprotein [Gammaproteobacteria bacterium]|nr:EexN family lipoprotein [Gammaproteobacteria bacterium]